MFRPHWVIFRPSKKTDPVLHVCFTETHCGIPNAHRILQRYSINCKIHVFVNIGASTVILYLVQVLFLNYELLDVVFSLWYVSWRLLSLVVKSFGRYSTLRDANTKFKSMKYYFVSFFLIHIVVHVFRFSPECERANYVPHRERCLHLLHNQCDKISGSAMAEYFGWY